jgi:hypothetical protein
MAGNILGVTHAADWFGDAAEWRQLCGDAQSQARSESAQDFARDMMLSANSNGLMTPCSEKQMAWLVKLADWEMPKRILR